VICKRISGGESVNSICAESGFPSRQTFYQWIAKDPDLRAQYEEAIALRADSYVDEIVDIADKPLPGKRIRTKTDEDGNVTVEELEVDNVERSRLQVDTRKWTAGRMAPKKYGDRPTDITVNTAISVQGLLAKISGDQRSLLPPSAEVQEVETKPV